MLVFANSCTQKYTVFLGERRRCERRELEYFLYSSSSKYDERCSRENGVILIFKVSKHRGKRKFWMQSSREAFAKSKVNGQKMSFRAEVSMGKKRLFWGAPSIQAQTYIRTNRRSVWMLAFWRVNTWSYILLLCERIRRERRKFEKFVHHSSWKCDEKCSQRNIFNIFPHAIYDG